MKKLLKTLKTDLQIIRPGKAQGFNVMEKKFSCAHLMSLKNNTAVVLIFDTDAVNMDYYKLNIKMLEECKAVSEIITIPQVKNFEYEMKRALKLKNISELYKAFESQGSDEFKRNFIRANNLTDKLMKLGFSTDYLWKTIDDDLPGVNNGSGKIITKK